MSLSVSAVSSSASPFDRVIQMRPIPFPTPHRYLLGGVYAFSTPASLPRFEPFYCALRTILGLCGGWGSSFLVAFITSAVRKAEAAAKGRCYLKFGVNIWFQGSVCWVAFAVNCYH
ncbi:hypothetical protein J5N97_013979 [Dioscorea zingiberensis]|uniref:Uncharacterized protein n=1 Tax=Dioscorea zingiberensis TaxID=325984 RepID=A0A9D5CUC7_9LILI|nr:hypothetical protein J5N97_013979 [Dioscorea zingiberensis]